MTTNRRTFLMGALAVPLAAASVAAVADDKPVTHPVLGQDRGHIALVKPDGTVDWELPCPGVAHDISLLPNGNILTQTAGNNVVELNPKGETVWKWDAKPMAGYNGRVEVHAFQRLKGDVTMVSETGNKRIIEVDKDGKIVHETPYQTDFPDIHRHNRMVRKLKNGNYLVCHEGDGLVREYDPTGKTVWEYKLDLNNQPETPGHDGHGINVFGAIRAKNGNTLIAGGNNNRVMEVNREGKVVWSVERDELPGIHLCWVTTLQELPNGHLIFGNTHAGPNNPQLVEVTRDKKVVWTFKNWTTFGNDLVATLIPDLRGVNR